jgi:hypothetical protein
MRTAHKGCDTNQTVTNSDLLSLCPRPEYLSTEFVALFGMWHRFRKFRLFLAFSVHSSDSAEARQSMQSRSGFAIPTALALSRLLQIRRKTRFGIERF